MKKVIGLGFAVTSLLFATNVLADCYGISINNKFASPPYLRAATNNSQYFSSWPKNSIFASGSSAIQYCPNAASVPESTLQFDFGVGAGLQSCVISVTYANAVLNLKLAAGGTLSCAVGQDKDGSWTIQLGQ